MSLVRDEQLKEANRILAYGLHLCMYGERAPGGDETWRQFATDAETHLRATADILIQLETNEQQKKAEVVKSDPSADRSNAHQHEAGG